MDVLEAIKQRRSVRKYKSDPVSEEKLEKILEAARLAPSAGNRQQMKLVVIRDPEKRRQIALAANNQTFVGEAPVVIAGVSTNPDEIMFNEVPTYPVDLAIAIDHMTLVAVEEGLGTCWIAAFSQNEVKKILNIPQDYKIVALMPLGYPDDKPGDKVRKNSEEIVRWETFGE